MRTIQAIECNRCHKKLSIRYWKWEEDMKQAGWAHEEEEDLCPDCKPAPQLVQKSWDFTMGGE